MPPLREAGPHEAETLPAALKPRLRGVSHAYACAVSLVAGALLIAFAPNGSAALAAVPYVIGLSGLLGASALYHTVTWPPAARRWMRRIDHSMIFVLIAGTYTPVALLVLHGTLATLVLVVVWAGAAGGLVFQLLWTDAPKPLSAAIYIALGWVAVAVLPQLVATIGWTATLLIGAGGLLYSAGAVVYARGRPDPWPRVFGYHEIFHALVILAAALHFAVIAGWVVPRG